MSITTNGPPPPDTAMAKYFADALMYVCSPVVVASLNPVQQFSALGGSE
jgi:hypothetical protein